MNTDARDLEAYVQAYRSLPFEATQAAFRRRTVLREVLPLQPESILEVGCGEAPLFTDLAPQLPRARFTVVEPAAAFARMASEAAKEFEQVRVVAERIEDVLAPLDDFDLVVVGCLLHEVTDPQHLLAAVRRQCGRRTVLHVNVPNAQSLHRQLAVAMGLIPHCGEISELQRIMQQRGTYDRESLDWELQHAGFEVLSAGSLFVKPFTHAQMQRLVDIGFLTEEILNGLEHLAHALPTLGSEIWCHARLRDA